MLHIEDVGDPEAITRDELAELVASALARFGQIEHRLAAVEAELAQRAEVTRSLSAAFSGVVAAIERLNIDS